MAVREILVLGNQNLYRICSEIEKDEIENAKRIVNDLNDTMKDLISFHTGLCNFQNLILIKNLS